MDDIIFYENLKQCAKELGLEITVESGCLSVIAKGVEYSFEKLWNLKMFLMDYKAASHDNN